MFGVIRNWLFIFVLKHFRTYIPSRVGRRHSRATLYEGKDNMRDSRTRRGGIQEYKGGTFVSWFIITAGVILFITGTAKVWSAFGSSKILGMADPIVGTKFGFLLLSVGLVEIIVALICFFCKRLVLALSMVAWVATGFAFYRLALWGINWNRPCSCLGNLTDALHISPEFADSGMKVLLGYLLICSYGLLVTHWFEKRAERSILSAAQASTISPDEIPS
jgi:hypothetical protein